MNTQYFSKEMVERGELEELVRFLNKQAYSGQEDGKLFNDIHIVPDDCGAFLVEWEQVPFDRSYGGSFKFVETDEGEIVALEKKMPYGEYRLFYNKEQYEEALQEYNAKKESENVKDE